MKGSRDETTLAGKTQIYVDGAPTYYLGNATQCPVFFCYLLGPDLNPKRETRRCGLAVSLWNQRTRYHCTRQQDTKYTRQAGINLSSKMHAMFVYNKGRQHALFGTWIVCQLNDTRCRRCLGGARARSQLRRTKRMLPGTFVISNHWHPYRTGENILLKSEQNW